MSTPNRSSTRPKTENGRSPGAAASARSGSSSRYIRECVCGRGLQCEGMTQAFRLLGDPRCYYVELPRYRKDPPAYKYVFRNNLRAAYLRHLKVQNPGIDLSAIGASSSKRHYVALHHFHPSVIKSFYENPLTSGAAQKHKVPISITEHELQELELEISEEDRILSVTGVATGGYYFCPSYSQSNAHNDLKDLIKKERATREALQQPNTLAGGSAASTPSKSQPATQGDSTPTLGLSTPPSAPLTIYTSNRERSLSPSDRKPKNAFARRLEEVNERRKSPAVAAVAASGKDAASVPSEPTETKEAAAESQPTAAVVDPGDEEDTAPIADDDESETVTGDRLDSTLDTRRSDSAHDEFNALVSDENDSDFNSLWEEDIQRSTELRAKQADTTLSHLRSESDTLEPPLLEADEEEAADDEDDGKHAEAGKPLTASTSSSTSPRKAHHPWETPKYRKHLEETRNETRAAAKPATFIDPSVVTTPPRSEVPEPKTAITTTSTEQEEPEDGAPADSATETSREETVPIPQRSTTDAASAAQKSAAAISAAALSALKSIDEAEKVDSVSTPETKAALSVSTSTPSDMTPIREDPPGLSPTKQQKMKISTPTRINGAISEDQATTEDMQTGISDQLGGSTVFLSHHLPGSDPTLRIQVHNDLIAWESKRRTEISKLIEFNQEKWNAARDVLNQGTNEVEMAERLVLGFAQAGTMFSDSLKAVYHDKFLDDAGNTVSNSFLQKRLYKRRSVQEYSIESADTDDVSGKSALLGSILEAQKRIAESFEDCSQHIRNEIHPEISELRVENSSAAKRIQFLGDGIALELKRSEAEVKNIWDVFDAMVTGDLMEYSVHGSMHGGSQHGGSMHSFNAGGGSLHGLMPNEGPIVSSVNSPLVKSTFKQLGALEDGWIVEMYYRCAVAYQRAVLSIAEKELDKLVSQVVDLEEQRFRKLHQILLSFVPRQRRLFNTLPDQLKEVLNDLVGLRIDEESLQNLIDESIKDRSHSHLKRGASHRSSIMNRSRVNKGMENADVEVEHIEALFGDPFKSSSVLLSKVVEMQQGGLRGMVNTTWKPTLVIVTASGKLHVFSLPADQSSTGVSPSEAFRLLYPKMNFGPEFEWSRKVTAVKSLSPGLSLALQKSTFTVPKLQHSQIQIVEENEKRTAGNRFMKVMKAAADSQRGKKCNLRLASASEVDEWMKLLERTKKLLKSKS